MIYFRKCPKCGRNMSRFPEYKFGCCYIVWACPCGYSETEESTTAADKTNDIKGKVNDEAKDWMEDDLISRKEALQVLEDVFAEFHVPWGQKGLGAAAQEVMKELPSVFDKREEAEEKEI